MLIASISIAESFSPIYIEDFNSGFDAAYKGYPIILCGKGFQAIDFYRMLKIRIFELLNIALYIRYANKAVNTKNRACNLLNMIKLEPLGSFCLPDQF